MYSFQQEFPKNINGIIEAITTYKNSEQRTQMLVNKSYYSGKNDFISKFQRLIWDDKEQRIVQNVYAPNYKTMYNFFADMVGQKVNSLLTEAPEIDGVDAGESKQIGFAMLKASVEASVCGYAYIYEGIDGTYKAFNTEQCFAYQDDKSGDIVRFIRFWSKNINNDEKQYFELYENDGFTTYQVKGNIAVIYIPKQFYKKTTTQSAISTSISYGTVKFPIVVLHNNQNDLTDLRPNIKSKIDMIDFIESGLCNNIDEFSDVWMTINAPSATEEEAQQIKETARRTKAVVLAGSNDKNSVGFQTMEIPYQSRQTAVDMLKAELVEDAGVIDFKDIQGTATNVQIEARLLKLKQRVSEFEWYCDKAVSELVEILQSYNGTKFDINVTFQKLYVKNNQEIVNIANSVYGKVSRYAYLKLLQQANVIDNADEEMQKQDSENTSKFDLGVDYNGPSTQTN